MTCCLTLRSNTTDSVICCPIRHRMALFSVTLGIPQWLMRSKLLNSFSEYSHHSGNECEYPMHTFFHGWRRKAGVITLVVTLLLMGGWLRSFAICDLILMRSHENHIEVFGSDSGSLVYWSREDDGPAPNVYMTQKSGLSSPDDTTKQRYWNWGPFHVGSGEIVQTRAPVAFVIIPYWSVTTPLTFVSAYLLLVPSRKRPPAVSQPHA
jgi:hypothetical protein